jgi:hypothetical protein
MYLRAACYYAFSLLVMRPILRILALVSGHKTQCIGKVKIIGDVNFIASCEEFSQWLQNNNPSMHDDLFVKNTFVFIQYSDAKYFNILLGEFAVPAHYQKFKASGVGALMVYALFKSQLCGTTLGSFDRFSLEAKTNNVLAREKTYTWLIQNQFPDTICKWFNQNKATVLTTS